MNTCNHPVTLAMLLTPFKKSFSVQNGHLITMTIRKAQFWASLLERAEPVPRLGKAVPRYYTGKGHELFQGQRWPLPLSPSQKKLWLSVVP